MACRRAAALVATGFAPLRAAVLSSWGQCAVPWGALGVGTVIGADLSGMSFAALSDWSALLSLPLFPVYAVSTAALTGGWVGVRRHGVEAFSLGLLAGVGTLLASAYTVPELSGATDCAASGSRSGHSCPMRSCSRCCLWPTGRAL